MIKGNTVWSPSVLAPSVPEIDLDTYQKRCATAPMGLYDALVRTAEKFPEKVALELEDKSSLTFAQLLEQTHTFSAQLASLGIRENSRVGLLLDNNPQIFIALYAVNQLGAIAVMLPGKLRTPALVELLNRSAPDITVVDISGMDELSSFGHRVVSVEEVKKVDITHRAVTAHPNPGRVALMMFTSGTSGTPKAVAISNANVTNAALSYEFIFQLDENDKLIFGVPLYHVTGIIAIIAQVTFSACTLYLQRRFSPLEFLEWAKEVGATYIHASPTVFELLLRSWPKGLEIPSIRVLACGAASMPTSRILRLKKKLPHAAFRTIYGLTETTSPATIFPSDAASSEFIGSSGWPIPGNEIRIVDDSGREVAPGEVGEIEVKGATVCLGYFNDRGVVDQIDSLKTGDLGYLNEHGLLYVVDRRKDQINRGGEKVYPHIVEEALNNVDGVVDACVVALPDELFGEVPGAIFVGKSQLSIDTLCIELKKSLASFAIPSLLLQVDEIPKTAGLKADKNAARELLQQKSM